MNISKLCLLLSTLSLTTVAHAATDRHTESAAPVLVAVLGDASLPTVRMGTVSPEAKPESAGVAEAVPEMPAVQSAAFLQRSFLPLAPAAADSERPGVMNVSLPAHASVSTLGASPLRSAAKMVRAQRFNTEDGSSINAFAICYRLNGRSSLQVIPGDPAPVKMAVTSMANNTGVTVGMVMRLSKRR